MGGRKTVRGGAGVIKGPKIKDPARRKTTNQAKKWEPLPASALRNGLTVIIEEIPDQNWGRAGKQVAP